MNTPRTGRATDFDEVLGMVRQGKQRAWSAVNAAMIETYLLIGAYLERRFRENGWGTAEVQKLSDRLIADESGSLGFSVRNLLRMKECHEVWATWPGDPTQLVRLDWRCHLILLERCQSAAEMAFYLDAAIAGNWNHEKLASQIEDGSYLGKRKNRC